MVCSNRNRGRCGPFAVQGGQTLEMPFGPFDEWRLAKATPRVPVQFIGDLVAVKKAITRERGISNPLGAIVSL